MKKNPHSKPKADEEADLTEDDLSNLTPVSFEEVVNKIQEGIQSGPSIPADKVFERLTAKYQAMLENPREGMASLNPNH